MTTSPQTLIKQPAENRLYDFDFVNLLPAGASVASVEHLAATLEDGTGEIKLGTPVISGTRVQVRVEGGSDGALHKITCRVTDTVGNVVEQEGLLKIDDI
ncbi:MAG TPA: hypothetical protein VF188_08405 [Longimicrobiales bacterium]